MVLRSKSVEQILRLLQYSWDSSVFLPEFEAASETLLFETFIWMVFGGHLSLLAFPGRQKINPRANSRVKCFFGGGVNRGVKAYNPG
jgi:hypothetical protein